MEVFENIAEYYDEFFPILDGQMEFFDNLFKDFPKPVKFLGVNCGTGIFEHYLSTCGHNVTAIESVTQLLESATRRRRTQLMTLNIFKMTTLEMGRFLGKGFFNVISSLNGRIALISDKILIEKFFFDCKQLLSKNGKLVISLPNFAKYSEPEFEIPATGSIRVKLIRKIRTNKASEKLLEENIENGNGKLLSSLSEIKICTLTKYEIEEIAKKIGFSKVEFYSDFKKTDFDLQSDDLICVLSC